MRDDFAVFILTHGRADVMKTTSVLEYGGYTGRTYFVIDDEDAQAELYKKRFGEENVITFCKQEAYDETDTMDTFNIHSAIVYARNRSFKIAKDLGLKYFLQLDDDFIDLQWRWIENGRLRGKRMRHFDDLFNAMIRFLEDTDADTVAFCQGGDYIGGAESGVMEKGLLRKAMNSYFCRTDRPITFRGTMNEDVVTYSTLSSRGHLFFSVTGTCIIPLATQSLKGGMTEEYRATGTYLKSFYSVMSMPSAVKVDCMMTAHSRIHHSVSGNNAYPKIIGERYRK